MLNFYTGLGGNRVNPVVSAYYARTAAQPDGYAGRGAYTLPVKAGGMSSWQPTSITVGGPVSDMLAAMTLTGAATLTWSTTTNLALTVGLTGDGTITLSGTNTLSMTLGLAGDGPITFSSTGALAMLVPVAGDGTMTLTGAADLKGRLALIGEWTPFTELSPQSLAEAVKNAVIEKSLDGTTDITIQGALRIALSFMAGKMDIVDMGGGVFRYTYRNPADTKDRLVGTVRSSDGDRTAITTLDPA